MSNENRIWKVYAHIVPKEISKYEHDKYYIGITSLELQRRWKVNGSGYKRQRIFWNAIQKYGWDNLKHVLISDNLTHNEACEMEIELIQRYSTTNREFGYNLTKGGEGSVGYMHSEEVRMKMKGRISWNKGRKASLETRLKISENHWDSSGLNSPNRRSVICLNNLKVFDLITEATLYAGFKKYDKSVSATCRKIYVTAGFREDVGGRLYWMYYDEYINLSGEEKEALHNNAINQVNSPTKAVIRLNDNKVYQSLIDARKDTICSDENTIKKCCEGKSYKSGKMENGECAYWMYYHEYFKLSDEQKNNILSIKRFENQNHTSREPKMVKNLDTNVIYPSLKAAGNAYGKKDGLNIANAIKRNGTAYGVKWAYVQNEDIKVQVDTTQIITTVLSCTDN